jgi:hypothetical protein
MRRLHESSTERASRATVLYVKHSRRMTQDVPRNDRR